MDGGSPDSEGAVGMIKEYGAGSLHAGKLSHVNSSIIGSRPQAGKGAF